MIFSFLLKGKSSFFLQAILYITCVVLMAIGRFAAIPFLAFYIHDHLTQDPLVIGVALGINGLFGVVGGVLAGFYIDKYSPKILMIFMGFLVSFVFLSYYAGALQILSLLFLGNAFIGGGHSAFETSSKTYVMSSFPHEYKRFVFSLRYMAINVGTVVGPILGIWFVAHNPKNAFLLVGIVYFIATLSLGIFLDGHVTEKREKISMIKSFKGVFSNRSLVYITLASVLFSMLFSQITTNIPQVLQQYTKDYHAVMGMLLSMNAVIVILLSAFLGLLLSKKETLYAKTPYMSCLLVSCAYVFPFFSYKLSFWILFIAFLSVGEVLFVLSEAHLIDCVAPSSQKGMFFGMNSMSRIGSFLGPVLGGVVLKYFSFRYLFGGGALLILGGIFLFYKVFQGQGHNKQREGAHG